MDSRTIRVVIRVRPRLPFEGDQPCYNNLIVHPDGRKKSIRVLIPSKSADYKGVREEHDKRMDAHEFTFDQVLGEGCTQEDVYHTVDADAIITSVLNGFNATIFAYGQTGSGKTFTMDGLQYVLRERKSGSRTKRTHTVKIASPEDQGIVFRCIDSLFERVARLEEESEGRSEDTARVYTIKCSFLQIYQEHVHDLLAPIEVRKKHKVGLKIRWGKRKGFFVENLYKNVCETAATCKKHFITGVSNRAVASHAMNTRSSRSHSIFSLYLISAPKGYAEMETISRMNLVDLAGSERIRDTGATGMVVKQSIAINRSLFVLRKVIKALSVVNRKQAYFAKISAGMSRKQRQEALQGLNGLKRLVPYRDSALTRLLKNALGGNSITVMIACLGPRDVMVEENCNTLRYASLAKSISNRAVVNADPRTKLIQQLQAEVKSLREKLVRSQRVMQLDQKLSSQSLLRPIEGAGSGGNTRRGSVHSPSLSMIIDGQGGGGESREEIGQHLVESVQYIKELMHDNSRLRDQLTDASQIVIENDNLNKENAELRHQVKFYESLVVSNKNPEDAEGEGEIETFSESEGSEEDEVDFSMLMNSSFTFKGMMKRDGRTGRASSGKLSPVSTGRHSSSRPSTSSRRVMSSSRGTAGKSTTTSRSHGAIKSPKRPGSSVRKKIPSPGLPRDLKSPSRYKIRSPSTRNPLKESRGGSAPSMRKPWGSPSRPVSKRGNKNGTSSSTGKDSQKKLEGADEHAEATIPMVELAKLFEERSKIS